MSGTVFAKYIIRDFNLDGADKLHKSNDMHQENMNSYGTGRRCTEHDFAHVLS